jgi:hypothetical protein
MNSETSFVMLNYLKTQSPCLLDFVVVILSKSIQIKLFLNTHLSQTLILIMN